MKVKSIDHISFEGKDKVLDVIDHKPMSLLNKIRNFLNFEIEIPVTALILSGLLFISVITFKEKQNEDTSYPIMVIEAGGQYEVY